MEVLEAVDVAIPKEKKKDRDFIEVACTTLSFFYTPFVG